MIGCGSGVRWQGVAVVLGSRMWRRIYVAGCGSGVRWKDVEVVVGGKVW